MDDRDDDDSTELSRADCCGEWLYSGAFACMVNIQCMMELRMKSPSQEINRPLHL